MEGFKDVSWTLQDILQGERVDRSPNRENICIGLFHVYFMFEGIGIILGGIYILAKINNFGWTPPWKILPNLLIFLFNHFKAIANKSTLDIGLLKTNRKGMLYMWNTLLRSF